MRSVKKQRIINRKLISNIEKQYRDTDILAQLEPIASLFHMFAH